jgi:hypothetical protein
MTEVRLRALLGGVLLLVGGAGCKDDPEGPIVVDPGVTVGGLNFQLSGATITSVSGALPTADALLSPPVVRIDRSPSTTVPATITVSANEPFQTVLVQPNGSSSYVRIFLPAQTQLIGVSVQVQPNGATAVATAVAVAVGTTTRTSRSSALALVPLGN